MARCLRSEEVVLQRILHLLGEVRRLRRDFVLPGPAPAGVEDGDWEEQSRVDPDRDEPKEGDASSNAVCDTGG